MLLFRQYNITMMHPVEWMLRRIVVFNLPHSRLKVDTYNGRGINYTFSMICVHEVDTTSLDRLFLPFIQIRT